MSAAGWFVMLLSVCGVLALFVWCIVMVLTIPEETEHVHGFDPDTPDQHKEPDRSSADGP